MYFLPFPLSPVETSNPGTCVPADLSAFPSFSLLLLQNVMKGHENTFTAPSAVPSYSLLQRSEERPQPLYLAELKARGMIIMTTK